MSFQRYRLQTFAPGIEADSRGVLRRSRRHPFYLVLAPDRHGAHGTAVCVDNMDGWKNSPYVHAASHAHDTLYDILRWSLGSATYIDLYPHALDPHLCDLELWTRQNRTNVRIYHVRMVHPLLRSPTHGTLAVPYDPLVALEDALLRVSELPFVAPEDFWTADDVALEEELTDEPEVVTPLAAVLDFGA